MKGEGERKSSTGREAVKENQSQVESSASSNTAAQSNAPPARQPFTQLSQLESDMAIARALQEQERAYMLLRTGGGGGGGGGGGYNGEDEDSDEEEDNRTPSVETIDGSQYDNDEEFARALQEAEYRETTARMMAMAGIQDLEEVDGEGSEAAEDDDDELLLDEDNVEEDEDIEEDDEEDDYADDLTQEMWQDVDPDEMSYEELVALGEVVGTESRGLTLNKIDELPVSSYKREQNGSSSSDSEQCVICRLEYEEEEKLVTLPCKHKYHSECIRRWLQINKVCPVCTAGVDSS